MQLEKNSLDTVQYEGDINFSIERAAQGSMEKAYSYSHTVYVSTKPAKVGNAQSTVQPLCQCQK